MYREIIDWLKSCSSYRDQDTVFFFCTGKTNIAGLIDQHSFHAFVGKPEFKRAWRARNDDNLCARSGLYACRGMRGWRRTERGWNEIKREKEKKRETNENKGDDRRTRFAALASLTTA